MSPGYEILNTKSPNQNHPKKSKIMKQNRPSFSNQELTPKTKRQQLKPPNLIKTKKQPSNGEQSPFSPSNQTKYLQESEVGIEHYITLPMGPQAIRVPNIPIASPPFRSGRGSHPRAHHLTPPGTVQTRDGAMGRGGRGAGGVGLRMG